MEYAGQSKTLFKEFRARKNYKEIYSEKLRDYSIDTWYEYPGYGFLNEKYEPIVSNIGKNNENLSNFGDYADKSRLALPFVVEAYEELRQVFLKRAEAPEFFIPSYLGTLEPKKTYESFEDKYRDYFNLVRDQLSSIRNDTKEELLNNIINNIKIFPLTQSAFALSTHCPLSTTGLCVEVAELPHDVDEFKVKLLNSEGYFCFVQDAFNSGFFIDKNNPWRLIANLNSQNIRQKIQKYKQTTTIENIMDRFFRRKTQFEDFQSVISFFQSFGFNLTTEELISYTVKIRMAEVGMPPEQYEKINKQALDILRLYGNNYGQDPLKGPSSVIGKYCSAHLKKVYESKSKIDSYQQTTIQDFT